MKNMNFQTENTMLSYHQPAQAMKSNDQNNMQNSYSSNNQNLFPKQKDSKLSKPIKTISNKSKSFDSNNGQWYPNMHQTLNYNTDLNNQSQLNPFKNLAISSTASPNQTPLLNMPLNDILNSNPNLFKQNSNDLFNANYSNDNNSNRKPKPNDKIYPKTESVNSENYFDPVNKNNSKSNNNNDSRYLNTHIDQSQFNQPLNQFNPSNQSRYSNNNNNNTRRSVQTDPRVPSFQNQNIDSNTMASYSTSNINSKNLKKPAKVELLDIAAGSSASSLSITSTRSSSSSTSSFTQKKKSFNNSNNPIAATTSNNTNNHKKL